MTGAPATVPSPDPALDAAVGVPLVHRMLDRGWGRQHVVEAGDPSAPPVVLLHGWPQHWFAWRHVLRELAASHRLIAIDTRGFGWSTIDPCRPPQPITSTGIAADVTATLDDLGLDAAHVVGHDWGGWFAFRVATGAPERVLTVTTMAIMPPWLAPAQVLRHCRGLLYLLPMAGVGAAVAKRSRWVEGLVRYSSADGASWGSPDRAQALQTYVDRLGPRDARRTTQALYRRMVVTELREACSSPRPDRLPMPAEVWLGDHEQISKAAMFLPRTEPGELEVRTAVGAGHWLPDEVPAWVVEQLRAALTG